MVYKVKRIIQQYTLVDLLEILQYPKHPEYKAVKEELAIRNPSESELQLARKGLVYRNKTRREPLSVIDILYCLVTPLIAPKTVFTSEDDVENSFEDQLSEFEYYNESGKVRQLKRCKLVTQILYGVVTLAFILFVLYILLFI